MQSAAKRRLRVMGHSLSRKREAVWYRTWRVRMAPRRSVRLQRESTMFNMTVPWWELVLRSVLVYAFLIALLRVTGKRQVGQLAPFDLVLLLVLSNAVQNSMNGGDNSVVGGLLSAIGLVAVNWLVSYSTHRYKGLARLVEGRPQ